jgi:hypothetical protein
LQLSDNNASASVNNGVKFYNGRGTAEQWIKEERNAAQWTKLSCRTFKDNQTGLQIFTLTDNLADLISSAGPLSRREAPVTNDAVGKARQGDASLKVRDIPASRSHGDASFFRSNPRPD